MDRLLDQERAGSSYMRMPAVARAVIGSIRKGAVFDYRLHAWAVMPNHVHLLLTPDIHPSVALQRLKGASAREANQLLGLTGQPFWQAESFDHLVRSQAEFERIENYIISKPGPRWARPIRTGVALVERFRSGGLKPSAD